MSRSKIIKNVGKTIVLTKERKESNNRIYYRLIVRSSNWRQYRTDVKKFHNFAEAEDQFFVELLKYQSNQEEIPYAPSW
jgi:hypothetical protein